VNKLTLPERKEPRQAVGRNLKEKEAAERLNLSVRTLQSWRVRGIGPPFLKLGAAVRYPEEGIEAWKETRLRSSTSDPGPDVARSRRRWTAKREEDRRDGRPNQREQSEKSTGDVDIPTVATGALDRAETVAAPRLPDSKGGGAERIRVHAPSGGRHDIAPPEDLSPEVD
jgi:predicted DNA-binding transcriptional regulator AlpA